MAPLLSLRLANRILVTRSKKEARKQPPCQRLYPFPSPPPPSPATTFLPIWTGQPSSTSTNTNSANEGSPKDNSNNQQGTPIKEPRLVPRLIKGSHRRHKDPPFNQIQTSYSRHSESCFSLSLLTHAYSYATSALTSSSPPASMLQLQLQSYQRGEVKEKK
jgi:hypothetical protein